MAIKNQPVYECDYCETEMDMPEVETEDVSNEGCSEIIMRGRTFEVGVGHYCSLDCLFGRIREFLETNPKHRTTKKKDVRPKGRKIK